MNTNKIKKYWLIRIINFSLLVFIIVIYSKNSFALYYNGGNGAGIGRDTTRESLLNRLLKWLELGNGRILIVNNTFLAPPIFNDGNVLYESTEDREKYYHDLGLWKKVKLKEYRIKEISWVDSNLPLINQRNVELKALLPEKDIINNLPENNKIFLKGKTEKGEEVPLIYEVNRGKNRIINIAFSLSPNLDIEKSVTMSILGYIKTTGSIIPVISCSAHTGYTTWQGTVWESDRSSKNLKLFSGFTGSAIGEEGGNIMKDLSSILFWSAFFKNIKPVFVGLNLVDEPIHPITSKFMGKLVSADIVKVKGMCMISPDGSTFSATFFCKIDEIVQASTDRVTQWLIETLDGRDSAHTDLLRISTESTARVSFLRPTFWVEEELIHAFKIEEDRLEPFPIIVDKKVLILKSTGGNYLVYYGQIKETKLSEFWKKFCLGSKDKRKIEGETLEDYSKYWDDFNVHWIEL